MPTPIADAWQTQRPPPPLSPPPGLARSLSSSQSTSGRLSRSTHRTSVSILPDDDPFAPPQRSVFKEVLEDEEWSRISEERPSQEGENGRAMPTPAAPALAGGLSVDSSPSADVGRRPSFLRTLLAKPRRVRSSASLSVASISSPILAPTAPPRLAPLHSSAELVSLADVTQTLNLSAHSGGSSRVPSPSFNSPSSRNVSFSSAAPPSRSVSRAGSISLEHPSARPAKDGPPLRRPRSAMELLPPTTSNKAWAMLGGPKVTYGNRKAVEKLTGVRTSVVQPEFDPLDDGADDTITRLGIALTTDAPTRRIVPDNARYSLASFSTATTDSQPSGGYDRSTQYSSTSGSFSRPGISPRKFTPSPHGEERPVSRLGEVGEEEYDPAKEDGAPVSLYRHERRPSEPLSPPPSAPLPPLPASAVPAPARSSSAAVEQHRANSSVSSDATAKPPLVVPSRPPSSLSTASTKPPIPPRSAARPPPPVKGTSSSSATEPRLARPVSSATALPARPGTGSSSTVNGNGTFSSAPPATPAPLASLYLVCGLPKDPSTWSFAQADPDGSGAAMAPEHSLNAVPRFWRPEVLGCEVSREGSGVVGMGKEELRRVQGKAMKLAFNRDVEVIASTSQPAATSSIFSFSAPSTSSTTANGSLDASVSSFFSAHDAPSTTYHAVALTVWSHADPARSAAIRSTLAQSGPPPTPARARAVVKATKAAKVGKKLGERLARQMQGAVEAARGAWSDTEPETEQAPTESEWESSAPSTAPLADIPLSLHFWLPYSLILVSSSPLYSFLSDVVRLSWARYHTDIARHALQMERALNTPAPRPGEKASLPVSVGEKQTDTFFVATMPGEIDWTTGAPLQHDFPVWPVFRALHADNLLTIAELALAPLGRIIFISRNSLMLGIATLTFQTILETRGWRGIVHSAVHARDLRIYLEDPGPWLISIPSHSRSLALSDLPPEIAVVDLDANLVSCAKPPTGAVSTGATRERARKRLEAAVGEVGQYHGVPVELGEAFPGGRFRPFSLVEVDGQPRQAERLKSDWQWNEALVLKTFDEILAEIPRTGFARLFRSKRPRTIVELDANTQRVQSIVRKHTNHFVDRRDLLEAKVNAANLKLAALVRESTEWQKSFEVFRAFSDKLTKESTDLKTRLERERRESRRLTGQILAEKERHEKLEASLEEVERAREQAMNELTTVDTVRQQLEQQQMLLMQEMNAILQCADDETSPLFQAVYSRIESLSHRSETPSLSRPGTSQSLRSSSRLRSRPSFMSERESTILEEDKHAQGRLQDSLAPVDEMGDDEQRLEAVKLAVQETFRSISSRLSLALQTNSEFGGSPASSPGLLSQSLSFGSFTSSRSTGATSPRSPAAHARPRAGPSPDPGPFKSPSAGAGSGFQPKLLTLTPPISPDLEDGLTPSSFVTVRPEHRRIPPSRSNGHGHVKQSSLRSILSTDSADSSSSTPTAASLAHTVIRDAGLVRSRSTSSASLASFVRAASAASQYSTQSSDFDAQSFVSVSEGFGGQGYDGGAGENGRPESASFELEELALTVDQNEQDGFGAARKPGHSRTGSQASPVRSEGSWGRKAGHGRQESWAIDAPPVELFTRSMRGRRSGGGSLGGSVDLRGRALSPVENGA
ncbi:hypothetical protein JCM10207_002357 [Rhodosporidiobolus poonsookiae]